MKKILLLAYLFCIGQASAWAQNSVMDFYKAEVTELGTYKATTSIKKQDVQNGFISYNVRYADGKTVYKEMAYFVAQNGKKFVAIVTADTGKRYTTDFRFYELQNGVLVAVAYCPPEVMGQVEEALKKVPNKRNVWIKLPQFGTTIQFGEMLSEVETYQFSAICELQFDAQNATFQFVQK